MTFVENDDILHPYSLNSLETVPFLSKTIQSFRDSIILNIDLYIERIQSALEQTILQF